MHDRRYESGGANRATFNVQQKLELPNLQTVEAFRTINQGGDDPTGNEDANDHEAEIRKVIVQTANDAPESTYKAELVADQSEGFDTSDK
jgi:hypothetical protein